MSLQNRLQPWLLSTEPSCAPVCRLVAKQGGRVWVVPEEGPPLNRAGQPEWPPGWHRDRPVTHERDVFELLRIPYHPPNERNCP